MFIFFHKVPLLHQCPNQSSSRKTQRQQRWVEAHFQAPGAWFPRFFLLQRFWLYYQTSFGNDTRKTVLHTEMSTSSGRSSSTGSDSAETVTRPTSGQSGQSHGVYQPMYYQYIRRQTPEEDYLSTQQGIEILVKQRQELVDQLTKHYRKLHRSNDIEQMLKFSQQIDSIMR